jgi:TolA-binding protein
MFRRVSVFLLISAAILPAADNRDIQELQRDVAQLQEMIKNLQQAFDQRLTAMAGQIQGVAGSVDKVDASVATLQKGLEQIAHDQDAKIVPLVAAQGSRVDQAAGTLNTVQQALADLTSAVNKLQAQVLDVSNAVKVMSAPAAPPPGGEKPAAADLLNNAAGDASGGKPDLALRGYSDYLKFYGDTPMAHEAQFQIGMLHYGLKDFETAVNDFDALAQKYPDSAKMPEALFYKHKSLQALGRGSEAAKACQELRRRFPGNELAKQCVTARR